MLPRAYSLIALIAIWAIAAALFQSRLLPGPMTIGAAVLGDIRSGELPFQMACTLGRVAGSFAIAMVLGAIAGYAMGRSRAVDRYADPWLVVLLNMPALVIIIFAYIWIGLNETAAILRIVVLPQPEGPISAPNDPASRRSARPRTTSTGVPSADIKLFASMRSSSGLTSPAVCASFKRLHHEAFDHQHKHDE